MNLKTLSAIMLVPQLIYASSGFGLSCHECYMNHIGYEQLLHCKCDDGNGGERWPNIDLNECFANDYGYLVYRDQGGFGQSCINIYLTDSLAMNAACPTGTGWYGANSVSLNDYVGNDHGILVC